MHSSSAFYMYVDAVFVLCLVNSNCSEAEFACLSGECVTPSGVCDGNVTCEDRSDEIGCGTSVLPGVSLHHLCCVSLPTWADRYALNGPL